MIDTIIAEMGSVFRKGVFDRKTVFRFILSENTVTVTVDADCCRFEKGAATGKADCSCQTSEEMFRKIYYDGYRPGIMDFLGGAIRCDAPLLLPQFLRAFEK